MVMFMDTLSISEISVGAGMRSGHDDASDNASIGYFAQKKEEKVWIVKNKQYPAFPGAKALEVAIML